MYPSQGRFWLMLAGASLACCAGCNQPPQMTTLGNLPGQTVSDLEPKVNATTYFAHGYLLERQGQFERAVVQYRKASSLRPDFLSARNRLGITLNKLGRHAEATAQFRQAVATRPERAYLRNNLGFSLYLEGRYAEAEAALEQALSLKPDFPRAHLNRALVLARLRRLDDAFSELMQVGSEADACFNMGILLTEAAQYADAARYLESALAVKPDFDAARQQLREVSLLAAEAGARQAASLALAAETTTEDVTPQPTETVTADSTTENVTPEPVATAAIDADTEITILEPIEETVVSEAMTGDATAESIEAAMVDADAEVSAPEPTETVRADTATEGAVSEPAVTAALDADTEITILEPIEETVVSEAMTGDATAESIEAAMADGDAEVSTPEPAEIAVADAEPETTTSEEAETVVEDAMLELTAATVAETTVEDALPEATPAPAADVVAAVDERGAGASPPPSDAAEIEPSQWAQEPGIDPEVLFALINEALTALRNQSDDFEALWCQVSYYLFPETAPDAPMPAPENTPEELILDRLY